MKETSIPKDIEAQVYFDLLHEPREICEWDKRRKCDSYYIKINKELQERIDKAIEYIKGFDIEYLHETMEHGLADNLEIILEILKGDSNE